MLRKAVLGDDKTERIGSASRDKAAANVENLIDIQEEKEKGKKEEQYKIVVHALHEQ
jgi:peptidyl-tRNA hydrolase